MGRHIRAMQLGAVGATVIVLVVVSLGWQQPAPRQHSDIAIARHAALAGSPSGVEAHPGGAAGRPVWQCNSVDARGRARAGIHPAFFDITSRGWGCQRAIQLVRIAAARWRGQGSIFRGGRLRCRLLYSGAGQATIRCWSRGVESVRFTMQTTHSRRINRSAARNESMLRSRTGPAIQCGAFRTWFDISVEHIECADAGDIIRAHGRAWDRPQIGRQIRVRGGFRCSVLYAEFDQPTYRCVHPRGASIRFTLSNETFASVNAYGRPAFRMQRRRAGTQAEALLVSISARRADASARERSTKLPRHLTARAWLARPERSLTPVAPLVLLACPSFGDWTAVTSVGIACDQIQRFVPAVPRAAVPTQLEGLACVWEASLYRCASSTGWQGFVMRPADRSD